MCMCRHILVMTPVGVREHLWDLALSLLVFGIEVQAFRLA